MQPLPVVCFALFEGSGKITVQTSSYMCALNPKDCSSGNLIESKLPSFHHHHRSVQALLTLASPFAQLHSCSPL